MTYLVTGVAGFIGSSLADQLLISRPDATVIGVDSFTNYYDIPHKMNNLHSLRANPRFKLIEGDLNSLDLSALVENVEYIFHQAGQPGVRKSWGVDFTDYVLANISATQRLLEAAKGSTSLKRLVYASSSSVYGDAERYPTSEDDSPLPRSPYGVTKLAAEHLCSLYAANFGLPTVSLRYFTVYGPRQRPDMAFNRFIEASLGGAPLPLFGDGEQIREFTHVKDIVRANILAAETDVPPGLVMNLSGGASVSVNEVLSELRRYVGPINIDRLPSVAGDVRRTGGDSTRALEILGWKPEISLEVGLADQVNWQRARKG